MGMRELRGTGSTIRECNSGAEGVKRGGDISCSWRRGELQVVQLWNGQTHERRIIGGVTRGDGANRWR